MPTKFTVDGDVSGAKQALGSVASELGKVESAADATGKSIDRAMDTESAIAELKSEIYELKRGLDAAEASAKSANDQLAKGADAKAKWAEMAAAAGGIVQTAKAIVDGIRSAREGIRQMAENGVTSFNDLNTALNQFDASVTDMVANLASSSQGTQFTGWLGSVATGAGDALKYIDSLDEGMTAFTADLAADAAEMVGWSSAANTMRGRADEMRESMEKIAEVEFAGKQTRQLAEVDKVFEEFNARREAQRKADEIGQITSIDAIDAKMKEQRTAMEALAKSTTLSTKDKQDAARTLDTLERRRVQIIQEQADAEKKAAADAIRLAQDEADAKQKQYDDDAKALAKAEADKLATEKAAADERKRMADAEAADRQKQIDDLAKQDGVKDAAAKIQAKAADPKAIIERLAKNAEDTGIQAAMQDGSISREEQKEIDQMRRDAHRKATLQAQGGPQAFSQDQIAQAQQQNAQAQVQSMQAAGQTSQMSIDALSKVLNLTQQFDQQQQQAQQQIDAMMQALDGMANNRTTRARNLGARRT